MLIVYQSLESSGTIENTVTSIFGGRFKKDTHRNLIKKDTHRNLTKVEEIVPFSKEISTGVYSEEIYYKKSTKLYYDDEEIANIYETLERSDFKTVKRFLEAIISTIKESVVISTSNQGVNAARIPDVIVLGEIGANELLGQTIGDYRVTHYMNPTGDARHRFITLVHLGSRVLDEKVLKVKAFVGTDDKLKNENAKCMMLEALGWVIACVHIPNKIRNNGGNAAQYLLNNTRAFGIDANLDLVIGDTNQGGKDRVTKYMSGNYNKLVGQNFNWNNSIFPDKTQNIVDYNMYSVEGTNSTSTEHFDIACTRHTHVKINKEFQVENKEEDNPAFVFHGLTKKMIQWDNKMLAYSDHNGVILEILQGKDQYINSMPKEEFSKLEKERTPYTRKLTLKQRREAAQNGWNITQTKDGHLTALALPSAEKEKVGDILDLFVTREGKKVPRLRYKARGKVKK